jgi:uncharacterized protein YdhG (YjbR/CyaY superfamily)
MATKERGEGSFTAEEKEAMRERAAEAKRAKGAKGAAADAEACVAAIEKLEPADRKLAKAIHDIVTSEAPELAPKTWYGMPAYASDGKVVVFFQGAAKFKERYSTLGFQGAAQLDEGNMWPTSYAVTDVGPVETKRIKALVKQACGR